MSAETIGLLAYGLRPAPLGMTAGMLTPGAYTSMSWDLQMAHAHAGCHVSAFCRNPLHPGPCKGWKGHLGLVAPGALHALEKIRHEKLEEKRKTKVKALQDAGHVVPKHLMKPIVYDPAKNKHIGGDKTTPGLGIPTQGLTPQAAKEALDKIPTKAQVGEKLDAKHAAEAAAAVPKPTEHPTYLTIAKAGLKDGDKVFLHGKGKATGEPQLVTVRKLGGPGGGKTVGGGKATGYKFVDAKGNEVMHPHQDGVPPAPLAGGTASKWLLSPAPGKSFPDTPAQKVAANMAGFEKGEATKMDNLHKLGQAQDKATKQIDALTKLHAMVSGKLVSEKQKADMVAKAAENAQLDVPRKIIPDGTAKASADKIAAKLWATKPEVGNHVHQADLEQALAQDITDGVEHGKPTPVLDAAKEAAVTLGQDKPGAVKALADAVHAKLGISGHDDTPAKHDLGHAETALGAKEADHGLSIADSTKLDHVKKTLAGGNKNLPVESQTYVLADLPKHVFDDHLDENEKKALLSHLASAHAQLDSMPNKDEHQTATMKKAEVAYEHLSGKPLSGGNHLANTSTLGKAEADAFHDGPNAGAAPHVKQAIAYANGHQSGTGTKKLAAYHKLTPVETASLDPNTKKLMAADLEGMKAKFLNPKKQAHVLDVLNKVQVAQGSSGAGAGAGSAPSPTVDALNADHEGKAAKGAVAAYMHGYIHSAPGGQGHEALKSTLAGMHAAPDQAAVDKVFHAMGEEHAKKVLNEQGYNYSSGLGKAVLPHLAAEYKDAFKGGSKETPLADALSGGDTESFIHAVQDHPHLGESALGVKTAHAVDPTVDVAHALAKHAGVSEGKLNPDEFAQHYAKLSDLFGDDPADISSGHASKLGMVKGIKSIEALGLPKDVSSKLESQISDDLEHGLKADYSHAMDLGLNEPAGVAGKIDGIVKDVNKISDELAKKNGWPDDSPAKTSFKAALFSAQVKDALKANPGAGGGSTHTAPGHVPAPGSPNVTPAGHYSAPTHTPSATTKTEKGTILLKHAQALKVVKIMKSFPEGQYLESPEPKIWDNLVAISAHQGITPMQALTTLDDQNAKKLGLTNTNLLEKKVRAWLSTSDGKAYADANKTPKSALLDHVKKVDAGHTDFTNKTGIDLPPGEKVQKLGGPGEFEENAPAGKFGKHDVATAEADQIKFKKEQGIKFTPQQKAALTEYVNGSGSINCWIRDEHTPSQSSIDNAIYLQSMMMPTQRDHLLLRGTGWTQFPPEARSYEGLQKLIGETLEEPAFLSASVSKSSSGFGGAVKMHIEAPKGTMGVFTKDDQYKSQFLGSEAELLLAARTELKVLKVWKEGGQVQVLMRVVS